MHKDLQQKNLSKLSNRQNNIQDPLRRRHISFGQVYRGSMLNQTTPFDVRSVSSVYSMLPCSSQEGNKHRSYKSYSSLSTVPVGSIEVIFWKPSAANSSVDFSSDDISAESSVSVDTDPESFIFVNTDAAPSLVINSDVYYLSDDRDLESSGSSRSGILGLITQCFPRGRGTESTYSSPSSIISSNVGRSNNYMSVRDSNNSIMNFITQCFQRGRDTDSGRG